MPINAVYDDDLVQFLKNIQIYADLEAGELKCKFCREIITLDNLLSVFPDSGTIHVCCTKAECSEQLADYIS